VISKVRPRRAPRPNATLLCRRIVDDMARTLPEMGHVRAARILFVAGEARRNSRATVRGLGGSGHPAIKLRGKRALYAVTLRPKFFRGSSPEERVETLLHELFHISSAFDGALAEHRRHSRLPRRRFDALVKPLLRRYLAKGDPELLAGLAHNGEMVARQWLERPTAKGGRKVYTEKQLFLGPVVMVTRRKLH
jgi:predicted metallopeptidase